MVILIIIQYYVLYVIICTILLYDWQHSRITENTRAMCCPMMTRQLYHVSYVLTTATTCWLYPHNGFNVPWTATCRAERRAMHSDMLWAVTCRGQ